jgi:hypothetical protein
MWGCVDLALTNVSEERIVSILRAEFISWIKTITKADPTDTQDMKEYDSYSELQ